MMNELFVDVFWELDSQRQSETKKSEVLSTKEKASPVID